MFIEFFWIFGDVGIDWESFLLVVVLNDWDFCFCNGLFVVIIDMVVMEVCLKIVLVVIVNLFVLLMLKWWEICLDIGDIVNEGSLYILLSLLFIFLVRLEIDFVIIIGLGLMLWWNVLEMCFLYIWKRFLRFFWWFFLLVWFKRFFGVVFGLLLFFFDDKGLFSEFLFVEFIDEWGGSCMMWKRGDFDVDWRFFLVFFYLLVVLNLIKFWVFFEVLFFDMRICV